MNDPPNIAPSPSPQHYPPTQPHSQYMPSSSLDNNTYHEMEKPTAGFEPPGFGSFQSSRQHSTGVIPKHEAVTHAVMLAELSRMYEALIQKMVMENGALLATIKNENYEIKKKIDLLRKEVRSTYLSQRIPEGINTNGQAKVGPIDIREEKIEQVQECISTQRLAFLHVQQGKYPLWHTLQPLMFHIPKNLQTGPW